MGLLSFLFGGGSSLPQKDPKDYTLTDSSTPWAIDEYHCDKCKESASFEEFMAHICESCGSADYWAIRSRERSRRKIWNGSKWVTQLRYRNGESVILD